MDCNYPGVAEGLENTRYKASEKKSGSIFKTESYGSRSIGSYSPFLEKNRKTTTEVASLAGSRTPLSRVTGACTNPIYYQGHIDNGLEVLNKMVSCMNRSHRGWNLGQDPFGLTQIVEIVSNEQI